MRYYSLREQTIVLGTNMLIEFDGMNKLLLLIGVNLRLNLCDYCIYLSSCNRLGKGVNGWNLISVRISSLRLSICMAKMVVSYSLGDLSLASGK